MNIKEKLLEILHKHGDDWKDDETVYLDYFNVNNAANELEEFINDNFQPIQKKTKIEWIDEYLALFPPKIKPAGKLLRSDRNGCLKKMEKFINENKHYPKEVILEATTQYIAERAKEDYAYTMTASYFINKEGRGSELAARCQAVLDEIQAEENGYIIEEKRNNYLFKIWKCQIFTISLQ